MFRSLRLLIAAFALAAPLALTSFSGAAEARAPRGQTVESGSEVRPVAARRHSAQRATRHRQQATAKRTHRQHATRARRAAG